MPLLSVRNGQLVESDPARSDGRGFGRSAPMVDESTVVFLSPASVAARQEIERRQDFAKQQKLKARLSRRFEAARGKARRDEARRAEVLRSVKPVVNTQEQLVIKELMRQKMGSADFNQFERMTDKADFGYGWQDGVSAFPAQMGSRADFEQHSVIGNPLTPDGSHGPVTDYDRFVKGKKFARGIPSGMGTTMGQREYVGMGFDWPSLQDLGVPTFDTIISQQKDQLAVQAQQTLEAEKMKLLQQAGLAPKPQAPPPPPVQAALPVPLPAFVPDAIKQALTGNVSVAGKEIPKLYLAGALAGIGVIALVLILKKK